MDTKGIVKLIDEEVLRLLEARALLSGNAKARGRKKREAESTEDAVVKPKRKKKRKLSPEARARISEAVKRRWAKQKKNA
jgi:hypothetical protein